MAKDTLPTDPRDVQIDIVITGNETEEEIIEKFQFVADIQEAINNVVDPNDEFISYS